MKNGAKTDIVVGANFGDEGKGLAVDYLCSRIPKGKKKLGVLTNGGPQRAHTVVTPEGYRHVFHHLSSGGFVGADTYCSKYFLVNPILLVEEYAEFATKFGIIPKIFIDKSTGKEINVKRIHTFFWIEMQYWGIIYSILGVILLATKSITAAIICALVICAGFCYYFIKKKSDSSNTKQENTPTDKNEPSVQVETEEERLKRRQEKEDPRRFMPNFGNTDNA